MKTGFLIQPEEERRVAKDQLAKKKWSGAEGLSWSVKDEMGPLQDHRTNNKSRVKFLWGNNSQNTTSSWNNGTSTTTNVNDFMKDAQKLFANDAIREAADREQMEEQRKIQEVNKKIELERRAMERKIQGRKRREEKHEIRKEFQTQEEEMEDLQQDGNELDGDFLLTQPEQPQQQQQEEDYSDAEMDYCENENKPEELLTQPPVPENKVTPVLPNPSTFTPISTTPVPQLILQTTQKQSNIPSVPNSKPTFLTTTLRKPPQAAPPQRTLELAPQPQGTNDIKNNSTLPPEINPYRNIPTLPHKTTGAPKNALQAFCTKHHNVQIGNDAFATVQDDGPPHDLRFTCVFTHPTTKEQFHSGKWGADTSLYQVKEGKIWYKKRKMAEHAAAARALDCYMWREFHRDSSFWRICVEEPYGEKNNTSTESIKKRKKLPNDTMVEDVNEDDQKFRDSYHQMRLGDYMS